MKRGDELVDAQGWLTDLAISSGLAAISCPGLGRLGGQTEWVLLTPAEALLAARQSDGETRRFREQLAFTHLIVAPISDGGGVVADSGSHWSLFVAARTNLAHPFTVFHFDSAMFAGRYNGGGTAALLANKCGGDSSGVREKAGRESNAIATIAAFLFCFLQSAFSWRLPHLPIRRQCTHGT